MNPRPVLGTLFAGIVLSEADSWKPCAKRSVPPVFGPGVAVADAAALGAPPVVAAGVQLTSARAAAPFNSVRRPTVLDMSASQPRRYFSPVLHVSRHASALG